MKSLSFELATKALNDDDRASRERANNVLRRVTYYSIRGRMITRSFALERLDFTVGFTQL